MPSSLIEFLAEYSEEKVVFSLGDKVQHKTTGIRGKVVGYGDRYDSNGNYQITLKVELRFYSPIRPVAEDLLNRWQIWNERKLVDSNHSLQQASDEVISPDYIREASQDKP